MAMNNSERVRAFTLIEMLVVIAIILIMSGIVLKTTGLVLRSMAKSKAQHDLQQIQNALNEYHAEYGNYPPVDFLAYEYEGDKTRKRLTVDWLADPTRNTPGLPDFVPDMGGRSGWPMPPGSPALVGREGLGYRYGLVAYLWPRDRGQVHWYDKDTDRDKAAKAKWAGYLADVGLAGGENAHTISTPAAMVFTNAVETIRDPWRQDYHYVSRPPYQSYKLWSDGPTGNSADDINADVSFR